MNKNQDQFLYEKVDDLLRSSIPLLSKTIYENLNEWTTTEKLGLFAKEIHNRVLDAAHKLNFSANFTRKKEAQRIRDELLTSHYSAALGMKRKNITNILSMAPNEPERISLEAKIRTLGKVNPLIGDLESSANRTITNYGRKASKSYNVLRGQRSPAHMARLYKFIRNNPGIQHRIP